MWLLKWSLLLGSDMRAAGRGTHLIEAVCCPDRIAYAAYITEKLAAQIPNHCEQRGAGKATSSVHLKINIARHVLTGRCLVRMEQ